MSKRVLWLYLTLALCSLRAVDIIVLGQAPAEWDAAPQGTALGQEALNYFSNEPIPLDQGRILLDSRIRYQHSAQQGLQADQAFTWRTRVGYETPRYYGFYGLGEFENTWAMNLSDYQSNPPANGRKVIRDPRNNQLNRLFLGYSGYNSEFKGGRQTIAFDNHRFVSPTYWRQNDRTLDAVWVNTEAVKDLWLSYVYNWQVNTPSGVYAEPVFLSRLISRNHFVNVHYEGLPVGQLGAYFYYLDLGGNASGQLGSATTSGLFYEGELAVDNHWSVPVRVEYAFQVDNSASGAQYGNFWENYWHVTAGAKYRKYLLQLGFENLGGNGTRGLQIPIGAKHKFDGWAGVFSVTPPGGLRDYYLQWNAPLPYAFECFGGLHYFTNAQDGTTFGKEIDIGLSRHFSENLSALLEFAYYDGQDGASILYGANVTQVWVSMHFHL